MNSKKNKMLSDVGMMPWTGERGARGHKAQPGMGRQQSPTGGGVQAVVESGKYDCAHACGKTIELQLKK